jgi:hypothetical protein
MAVGTTSSARAPRKSATSKPTRKQTPTETAPLLDPERRRALIAEAAYFRAERRGFEPGHETEDWLAAELEVDTALTAGVSPQRTAQ